MADLNVSLILKLVDQATAPARAAMKALRNIGGEEMVRQAAHVQRISVMMANGLGTVTGRAGHLIRQLGSIQGILAGFGLYQIGSSAIRTASEFEQFNIQLTHLEGSADGAKKAMAWIGDFATRTPLELQDTVDAYARLRAFGIDPTNGSMQALVDTMAASGGNVETMNGLVLAFGQAWTKEKLQGEEAMQMLERGVPVWDILSKAMGKTTAEIMEMSAKGQLGRAEIQLLMDELGKRNAGAADDMSKSWDGMIANLRDMWTQFKLIVMDAGVFDFLKGKLQDLLTFLKEAAADGRLKAWAEATSTAIIAVLKGIWYFGVGVYDTFKAVWPVLDSFARMIGGWDTVAWAAGFLLFRGSIFALVGGFWQFGAGAVMVTRGFLGMGVAASSQGANLVKFGELLNTVITSAARLVAANPVIAAVAVIAAAVYVIYQNWDGIVAYFSEKIDRVRAAFSDGLLNGVLKLISEFNPFRLMVDALIGLTEYLTGWDLSGVKDMLYGVFNIDLVDAGVAMIQSLWDGMKVKIGEMAAWVKSQLTSMVPEWMTNANATGVGAETSGDYDAMGNPLRELGGPVRAGQTYMTGERGIELFTPSRDGYIIPNRKLAESGRGKGGNTYAPQFHISVTAAPGADGRAIARMVGDEIDKRLRNRYALDDGSSFA